MPTNRDAPTEPIETTVETSVDVGAFKTGTLPPVCVITGRPATSSEPRAAHVSLERSNSGLALIVFGAVMGAFVSNEVRGELPYNAAVAGLEPGYLARRKRCLIRGLVAGGLGVAAWIVVVNEVVGEGAGAFSLGMVGLVLMVVGLVYLRLAARRPIACVPIYYNERTGLVTIKRIHPDFAAATVSHAGDLARGPARSGPQAPSRRTTRRSGDTRRP